MKFKGILLDLDDTLYFYEKAHRAAISSVKSFLKHENLIKRNFDKTYLESRKYINEKLFGTAASHNRLLYFQTLCEKNNINSFLYAPILYDLYWDTFLKNMLLRKNILPFLDFCFQEGIKVCIVTDLTAHIQYRKIKRLKLASKINYIVTSEEAGVEKPDAKIFELAINKLNLKFNEVCMIGDNFEKDIVGANALGIRTFWLNNKNSFNNLFEDTFIFNDFNNLIEVFSE